MRSNIKIVLAVVALVATVGTLTFLNRAHSSGTGLVSDVEQTERPVAVRRIRPKTLTETLVHTGTLEANRDVVLAAEVAGKVVKVHRDLGDDCKRGDTLVQLDASTYQIAVMQSKAALAQANTAFEQSKRDLARAKTLHERQAVPAYELERAEIGEQTSAAVVEQATAALHMAQRNLGETAIRCPFDGVVAQRMVEVGQLVGPQTPLLRLVDAAHLKLTLAVGAAALARLEIGQRVRIADPSIPERAYDGEVARLGVAADPVTRTFPVEVVVPGAESGPMPGQVVRAVIDLVVHDEVLAVPYESVSSADGQSFLFLAVGDRAERRRVELGPRIDGEQIIRSGLEPGAAVVIVGQESLRHGDPVVVGASPTAGAAAAASAEGTAGAPADPPQHETAQAPPPAKPTP